MRKDMSKVLRERPRQGGVGKEMARKNRHQAKAACQKAATDDSVDVENLDFRGMKKVHTSTPYSWDNKKNKSFNSAPLRRWIRSQVGRKWNDIYSEMCQSLNMDIPENRHAHEWMVEMNTYLEGNRVMVAGIPPHELSPSWSSYDEFYIDPKDGTLQIVKKKEIKSNYAARQKSVIDPFRYIDPKEPLKQYHCINGVWYEIQFRAATTEEKHAKSFGSMERRYNPNTGTIQTNWQKTHTNVIAFQITEGLKNEDINWSGRDLFYTCEVLFGGPYLPLKKMQMSSKEIRRIKAMMEKRDSIALRKAG
jgi:hypothetical protein